LASPTTLSECTQTDLKLVPKRRFAFVGYKDEKDAQQVKEWFDGSFWGGVKIKVDFVKEDVGVFSWSSPRASM
jgi:multiple RNA-binding domain-containing protein 1